MPRTFLLPALMLVIPGAVHAGVHYSGERYNELPAQWRGFLLDHKTLRGIAVPPAAGATLNPLRARYQEEAKRLEASKDRSAADSADLGAIYIRLGEPAKAIALLRPALAKHPNDFRIAANLGTAWQLQGDLEQAAACLEQAVRLAPGRFLAAEEAHLRLVRLRLKSKADGLDDLFETPFVFPDGSYRPGEMPPLLKKKLPASAVGVAQQLALWLPADGRLLWQLAELAGAHGDIRTAAAMMDGCVVQFGMSRPDLREHRRLLRAAAGPAATSVEESKTAHSDKDKGTLAFRSRRPLQSHLDLADLPPISADGVNDLPWPLVQETTVDKRFRPTFPRYLKDLDGKQVRLVGFMQPLRAETDLNAFLFIEYPVGCWFCEMPETTSIVLIELEEGQTVNYQRGLLRVIGRLKLNPSDPEDFLYTIRKARIAAAD
ncbi:MAG: tetratricopeptide repeat protein [Gemmataceae bacterium]